MAEIVVVNFASWLLFEYMASGVLYGFFNTRGHSFCWKCAMTMIPLEIGDRLMDELGMLSLGSEMAV